MSGISRRSRQRHRRFVEQQRQRRQRRRPERAERVVRGAADGVVLEPRRDRRHQIQARRLGRGGDGVRGDLGILVGDQRRQIGQLRADVAGQAAEQHRRLDAGAAAFRAALAGHRPEQHARRFEVLVAAGPAVERDHAGADREVGEVAEGVDLGQRIDPGVVRQPEQRLGPHLDVGIVQQPLGLGPDRQVGGGPQRGQRPGADGGRLVGQERADGVEGRPPPALREGPQHVEDGLGIAGVEGLGQHRRGRSIHGRRGRALDVEPVLVQAVGDRRPRSRGAGPAPGRPRRRRRRRSRWRGRAGRDRGPGWRSCRRRSPSSPGRGAGRRRRRRRG